jgi:hypothetical protein
VVELEEVLQRLHVGVLLQLVHQLELPVDQVLRAARHVQEHLADRQAQPRLLGGDLDGDLVDRVERLGDLADLVFRADLQGLQLCGQVDPVQAGRARQLVDHAGQALAGDLHRGRLEQAQRAEH